MNTEIVVAEKAWKKLKLAAGLNTAVYIYGATGYGKTSLVKKFLRNKPALWYSCKDGEWTRDTILKAVESMKKPVGVVIDDLHLLKNDERQREILSLSENQDIWLVLIGRSRTPGWLMPIVTGMQAVVIREEDLRLSANEIRKILENVNVVLTDDELDSFSKCSEGNVMVVMASLSALMDGEVVDEVLNEKVRSMFCDYLDRWVISQWDSGLQEFLMKVSLFDSFTLPLAEAVTGDDQTAAMIKRAVDIGNFLSQEGDVYLIRPVLLEALRKRADKVMGRRQVNQCIYNAAHFYELKDDVPEALRLYEQCGEMDNIRSLLIKNGRRNPGVGYYYELRHYYLALRPEEIEHSPVLMAAMSMLYSILMNSEQSEYWYDRLKSFADNARGGEHHEAMIQKMYLDIALPHRGSRNILEIMKSIPAALMVFGGQLPEFSITSNLPSTMNGGKDFCEWSKKDRLLAETIGPLLTRLLGKGAAGLVNAALGESYYEKGMDNFTVMSLLARSQSESENWGRLEMTFVSIGLQARLNTAMGNWSNALNLLEGFEMRVRQEKEKRLLENIAAMKCRIHLLRGDMDYMGEWMEQAPQETVAFYTLERYSYLTKVRCYIALDKGYEALALLGRLSAYADYFQRAYIKMEIGILSAIVCERLGMEWKPQLLEALNKAAEYHFIRLISEEGAAVMPLLKKVRAAYLKQETADKEWFDRLTEETEQMERRYPGYLAGRGVSLSDFNETALDVLRMQASGMNMREIAEKLHISERTAKYHAAENYRKLGAKGKTDAVQIARSLNII